MNIRRPHHRQSWFSRFVDTTAGKVILGPLLVAVFMATGKTILSSIEASTVTNATQSQQMADRDREASAREQDIRELRKELTDLVISRCGVKP
jgi:hypothetical protein